jgi:hypothetical protein
MRYKGFSHIQDSNDKAGSSDKPEPAQYYIAEFSGSVYDSNFQ